MSKGNIDVAEFDEVYSAEYDYIEKRWDEINKDKLLMEIYDLKKQLKGLKNKEKKGELEGKLHKLIRDYKKERLQKRLNKDISKGEKEKINAKIEEMDESKKDELESLDLNTERNVDKNLVGLCFSGGGIRSATLNLGLVQAIAKKGIFKVFDYLSTISGGSYFGACISSLLSHEGSTTSGNKFPFHFDRSKKFKEEKEVIKHLRDHSNFLTPHVGLFSRDTWYMIAVILRGMFLNFIILFSFFTAILSWFLLVQYYLYWNDKEPWAGLDKWNSWEGWWSWPPVGYYFPITITMGFLVASIVLFPIIIWFPQFIGKSIFTHNFRRRYGYIQLCALSMALFMLFIILLPFGVKFLPGYVNNIVGGVTLASLFAIFKYSGNMASKYQGVLKRIIPIVIPLFLIGLCIYIMGEWLVPKKIDCVVSEDLWISSQECVCQEWEDMQAWCNEMWWFFSCSAGIFIIYGLFVNINRSSLHNFYRDKITETYILKPKNQKPNDGHSNASHEEVEVDHSALLKDLHEGENGAPYHLINATLNLSGEDEPKLRGRKADFFLFSKKYCGSDITRYRRTENYFDNYFDLRKGNSEKSVSLGRAATISGAAVNPQSGSMWGASISFLMTLMNARVGFWMPNPNQSKRCFIFWPWYLVYRELFSRTKRDTWLCNLADGNFIENLGIYQLVKRKCKYIVAVDVGADPNMEFKDLGNVLRKVRIDLGVQINLDVEMLRKQADTKLSKWHCVADTIHYSDTEKGILVYIKSSLTGDEPEDLFHYWKQNPSFPHETTADQFFDEAQFESYRQLGYHIGQKVFRGFCDCNDKIITNELLSEQFGNLLSKWRPPVPDLSKSFLRNAEKYMELEKLLKNSPELADYDLQTCPELEVLIGDAEKLNQAEEGLKAKNYTSYIRQVTHFCNMQLQLMENVWMALDMDRYYNYPDNRGWMNLFRRWARSEIFKMVWSINKGLYGRDFKEFAESHLNLPRSSVYKVEKVDNGVDVNTIEQFEEILERNFKNKFRGRIHTLKNPIKDIHKVYTMTNYLKIMDPNVPFVMGIAFLTKKGNNTMMIEFIVIRDYLQRMGLGKQIFKEILDDLKKEENKEITKLSVDIPKDTPNSKQIQSFYYRLGFREKGDLVFEMKIDR